MSSFRLPSTALISLVIVVRHLPLLVCFLVVAVSVVCITFPHFFRSGKDEGRVRLTLVFVFIFLQLVLKSLFDYYCSAVEVSLLSGRVTLHCFTKLSSTLLSSFCCLRLSYCRLCCSELVSF